MNYGKNICVRIDEDDKEKVKQILEAMGLSISDGIRVFVKRVVAERKLPFELKMLPHEAQTALTEAEKDCRIIS